MSSILGWCLYYLLVKEGPEHWQWKQHHDNTKQQPHILNESLLQEEASKPSMESIQSYCSSVQLNCEHMYKVYV